MEKQEHQQEQETGEKEQKQKNNCWRTIILMHSSLFGSARTAPAHAMVFVQLRHPLSLSKISQFRIYHTCTGDCGVTRIPKLLNSFASLSFSWRLNAYLTRRASLSYVPFVVTTDRKLGADTLPKCSAQCAWFAKFQRLPPHAADPGSSWRLQQEDSSRD